jgi:hypothetical protein
MENSSGVFEFVNAINGVSFTSGMVVSLLLALIANRRGDWVWKREIENERADRLKAEARGDRWERMALEALGVVESTVRETTTVLKQQTRG